MCEHGCWLDAAGCPMPVAVASSCIRLHRADAIRYRPTMWHVYFRAGRFFVPVVARTDAGYYLDIEPVGVSAVDDAGALTALLQQVIDAGNPPVPAPLRGQFPRPV